MQLTSLTLFPHLGICSLSSRVVKSGRSRRVPGRSGRSAPLPPRENWRAFRALESRSIPAKSRAADHVAHPGRSSYGPHLKPPSFHELRVPLLQKELEYTKGTEFVKSVDASDYAKMWDMLAELLDTSVEEMGEQNVVQLIIDNESNYVAAGYYLNPKYYYEKSKIENDPKSVRGLRKCIETLSESDEVEDKILVQLAQYKGATGLFGIRTTIRQRLTSTPAEWWKSYGAETPDLQLLAVKF
ncbi:hypothetical protein KIW84_031486 [Lathyrus oleraceus]|uniref:DUF659 domain-containing protein n=1 Tax=Pisum sativum TaxID=3888 RepID=A0A9D4XRC1_PEA|nr:hypothetical protein KIW84_031486 [Pisum sativum]